MTTLRRTTCAALLAVTVVMAGCTGREEPELSPTEVLAEAKRHLDETSGVRLTLSADDLPDGVSGLLGAKGVGTHAPAFKGELEVAASGLTATVPVVAVNGAVYAKLPYTTRFVQVQPEDYGAPDPAELMSPEDGLSSLLTAAREVKAGEPVRGGATVLTEYTATVPGEAVAGFIPSASATGEFDARFSVDEGNVLHEAVLSGPFYPGSPEVTYTISLEDYGTQAEIAAP